MSYTASYQSYLKSQHHLSVNIRTTSEEDLNIVCDTNYIIDFSVSLIREKWKDVTLDQIRYIVAMTTDKLAVNA